MKSILIKILFYINLCIILLNIIFNIDSRYLFLNIIFIVSSFISSMLVMVNTINNCNNKISLKSIINMLICIISILLTTKIALEYFILYSDDIIYMDKYNFSDGSGDMLILVSYDSGGKSGPTEVIYEKNYILTFKKSKIIKSSDEYFKTFDLEKIYEDKFKNK